MAIDFPNSPSNNQTYTVNDTTWTYDGSKWVITASGRTGPAAIVVSDTAPTVTNSSAIWFNSSNGKTYAYYTDANSSQWVEVGNADPTFSALTTKGDILTRSSSAMTRQSIGSDTQVLTATSSSASGLAWAGAPVGFRNLVINGDMSIDQRYGGSSVTPSATQYVVDRWQYQCSVGSKMTIGQNLNSITPPTGFSKYLGVQTGGTANVTVGSGDFFCINHYIEGLNSAQLAWGGSSAKTATLSFWVRSSVVGTHGVAFRNGANNRSYPVSYTINSANTWEYKSITLTGDLIGTWATDNTIGIFLSFNLGMGSALSAASGSWYAGTYAAPNNAVKVVETNSATFYVTGVQLEQNVQATPFEVRPYATELSLAQRYYQRIGTTSSDAGQYMYFASGWLTGSVLGAGLPLRVDMRGTPAVATSGVNTFYIDAATGSGAVNALATINHRTAQSIRFQIACTGTAGQSGMLLSNATTAAFFTMDAEL